MNMELANIPWGLVLPMIIVILILQVTSLISLVRSEWSPERKQNNLGCNHRGR